MLPMVGWLGMAACTAGGQDAPRNRVEASVVEPASPIASLSTSTLVTASASAASAPSAAPAEPFVAAARARAMLFPDGVPSESGCGAEPSAPTQPAKAFVRCMIAHRFVEHVQAQELALSLFDGSGDIAATEVAFVMDGGFRGDIRLVAELPVGPYLKHLRWVASAKKAMLEFEAGISKHATSKLNYRQGGVLWKFARSVGRTTPSAYAGGWEIGYNVSGSLHSSESAVRDTIFHEIFHLNDQEHDGWSRRVLGELVDGIAERCKSRSPCLKPYAPGKTMVRGGTYYAFQPDNGDIAHEYAAELATRYFNEQLSVLRGQTLSESPFKCAAPENAEAMKSLAQEFFGGVDLTPTCGAQPLR